MKKTIENYLIILFVIVYPIVSTVIISTAFNHISIWLSILTIIVLLSVYIVILAQIFDSFKNQKMNKDIKIVAPVGYKLGDTVIDSQGNATISFIELPKKPDYPKSWEEIKDRVKGYYVSSLSVIVEEKGNFSYKSNVFPTKEEAEACLALSQLTQLRDIYNEGWKPTWTDYSELKYCISYRNNQIYIDWYDSTNQILAFKTPEIRDIFLNNFENLIKIAKPFL